MTKRGFTLIELLTVIIVLSLLIMLVLPKITNAVKNYIKKTDALMLNMIEDAAKLYMDDNPDKFIKENGNNYCILLSDLVSEDYLKGSIEYEGKDITNTKGLNVKYNNGFEYKLTDLYKGSCTLANYITNLYKETKTTTVNSIEYSLDETHLLMNDRLGSNDVDKLAGNIRYYGANPNNYIDIGDRDSEGNIIFWRIIGVFKDVEVTDENDKVIQKEDLVKIIRADKLTSGDVDSFSWDYTSAGSYGYNWNDSTLQVMLNNAYYNSHTTNYYNNSTIPITLNFASTGLSSKVHSKIEEVKWSLGGHTTNAIYSDEIYGYERLGTDSWSGKIALMYPSDYGYSADLSSCQVALNGYGSEMCTASNWMYDPINAQWSLIPFTSYEGAIFNVLLLGRVSCSYANNILYTRPVMYLTSNVKIIDEKVTSEGLNYFVVE